MHLHIWDQSLAENDPDAYNESMVETDLKPADIYDDFIAWTGTIVIGGKSYDIELRQPTKY
jgi:hypothetical protein